MDLEELMFEARAAATTNNEAGEEKYDLREAIKYAQRVGYERRFHGHVLNAHIVDAVVVGEL